MNRKEKEACGRAWKRFARSVNLAAESHETSTEKAIFFAGWAAASGAIRRRIEKMDAVSGERSP